MQGSVASAAPDRSAPRSRGRRRSWLLRAAAVYGVLLFASHVVRATREPAALRDGEVRTEVQLQGASPVGIVWRDRASASDATPVLLLHGSPGRHTDLAAVADGLAAERRVVSPDLPGFGGSRETVPDYSIRAHADYALALLDQLELPRVHVVGYSMGGGVALEMAVLQPERVASLTLLSAIGLQELELLGSYHVNHALHGLQLAGLFVVHEGFPHFGAFDDGILSVEYARNFYDTDQRPLEAAMADWDGPMLIVHGEADSLVPFAAAREHHRLVPQSELVRLDGGHMLVFTDGGGVAAQIEPFLKRVDEGRASNRADADASRVAAAARPFHPSSVPPLTGFSLAILCILAAFATLVSEDLTCIAIGALVAQGRMPFLPGAIACFVGIFVGDLLLFLAGRTFGRRALGHAPLSWFLTPERVERSSEWFARRGSIVIVLSRFMPGARLPTYFAAGVLRTRLSSFLFWFALAAGIWTPLLVYLSSRIGGELIDRVDMLQRNLGLGLLAVVGVMFVLLELVVPSLSHRGRRLLLSRWRRLSRFEFWPRWALYAPIVLHVLRLAVRHRSLTAFTAANPAIPASGFIGESKGDILGALPAERLPATARVSGALDVSARMDEVQAFRSANELDWPIVVKPDVGQRGDGVSVVRSDDELRTALESLAGDVIVQEHVGGVEYGLFWVRHPEEERGCIFSAVEKRMTVVRGDGQRTLARLILDDDRAVCMAPFFLSEHAQRLETVLPDGEEFALGELGTHCRGAIFLDGKDVITPSLEAAVGELERSYDGFYFGRMDVRAPDKAALAAGEFKVLELNGVTSEAAHIYDPSVTLWEAWRTLARQWTLAFEFGRANVRGGARTTSVAELIRAVRGYGRAAESDSAVGKSGDSESRGFDGRSEQPCVR